MRTGENAVTADEAARRLARLMERYLGLGDGNLDAGRVRLMLEEYWSVFSVYSHVIHDAKERKERDESLAVCGPF